MTTMSAGSHTEPGGYARASDAEPQFSISDTRSPRRGGGRLAGRRLRPGLEGLAAGLSSNVAPGGVRPRPGQLATQSSPQPVTRRWPRIDLEA